MNNKRRTALRESQTMLNQALKIISTASDEESDCLDNIPENLRMSEKYERMEDAADNLEEAVEHIEEAIEHIEDAIECVSAAIV